MSKLRVLDLFSGIGGFSLGLERTGGFQTVAFCEIEDYPRKVLAKHWPEVPIYDDVRTLTAERLARDGIAVDVITGGFPCQDISVAGKQAGIGEGTRSGLWSEIARLVGELRPCYAIMENVTALLSGDRGRWFGRVRGDLAEVGYDCEWHCIPASELGAHHHRDRVWIVAYPNGKRCQKCGALPIATESHQSRWECNANDANTEGKRWGWACEKANEPAGAPKGPVERGGILAHPISERQQGQGEYVKPLLAEALRNWQAINAESGRISGIWAIESSMGGAFDGFPRWLDGHCGKGLSYEESQRSVKALRTLWSDDVAEALWQNIGGFSRVQQAESLFTFVREFQKHSKERDAAMEGEEICKAVLRSLWGAPESSCASLRPESSEQRPGESANALQVVPQLPSCDSEAAWQINGWEDGISRVANGIPHRAHRLKGLGNAVVPQIPELIGRAILEVETKKASEDA